MSTPRQRIIDALARYAERSEPPTEPMCDACGHPRRLHAEIGPWCARCAAPCEFQPEVRP